MAYIDNWNLRIAEVLIDGVDKDYFLAMTEIILENLGFEGRVHKDVENVGSMFRKDMRECIKIDHPCGRYYTYAIFFSKYGRGDKCEVYHIGMSQNYTIEGNLAGAKSDMAQNDSSVVSVMGAASFVTNSIKKSQRAGDKRNEDEWYEQVESVLIDVLTHYYEYCDQYAELIHMKATANIKKTVESEPSTEVTVTNAVSSSASIKCSNCGSPVFPGELFCGECGLQIGPVKVAGEEICKICPSCGYTGGPEELFCGECGEPLVDIQEPNSEELDAVDAVETILCPFCGEPAEPGDVVCSICGTKLETQNSDENAETEEIQAEPVSDEVDEYEPIYTEMEEEELDDEGFTYDEEMETIELVEEPEEDEDLAELAEMPDEELREETFETLAEMLAEDEFLNEVDDYSEVVTNEGEIKETEFEDEVLEDVVVYDDFDDDDDETLSMTQLIDLSSAKEVTINNSNFSIGGSESDLEIAEAVDLGASCTVRYSGEGYIVQKKNSDASIKVNGKSITSSSELEHHDILSVDGHNFMLWDVPFIAPAKIVPELISENEKIKLEGEKIIRFGRKKASNEAVSESKFVSRQHGLFLIEGTNCSYIDFKASNGTMINGCRIKPFEQIAIRNGDTIQIGLTEYKVYMQ